MKKLLALLAVLGVLLVAGCSSSAGAAQTVDAQAWLQSASQPGVTVIDVRTPAEYAAGHIDGAINIDVEGPIFAAEIDKLDKAGGYALYCHSGRRSLLAADQMTQAGFTKITNLKGGISDLQAAGGVVVTS
jgi:rhodanese-related sulfurtransferase